MKTDTIWTIRAWIYALCVTLLFFAAFNKYCIPRETYEQKMLREIKTINAHFWPPDMIPHPNLPEAPERKPWEINWPGGINA